ncbi:hypothetical protein IMSHALPRED_010342 [Imshaugia aleurites]|uniref:DUF6314 domain-containing protein n=1 Tax=Imshaugia aleurites TaxID=172621 RepID=A0A8H3IVU9_9LECA|nr:hypothetical protein IMSHALPRED_010342 [Imshaugia aleurites]
MAEEIMPKMESTLIPITALAFLGLGTSEPYLLVGEGQFLRVFDDRTKTLIHTERIFDSQAIHGISCQTLQLPQGAENGGTLLIWGGRSICLVFIEAHLESDGDPSIKIRQHRSEVLWDDWIIDGCFPPTNVTDSGYGSIPVEAILVTAHNDLLRLKVVADTAEMKGKCCLDRIASGPNSILYSAHMLWADAGQRLLVAAGTVFGEVLLWSFAFDHSASSGPYLHYRFTGHEGSVFGVRIAEVTQARAVKRILASCSDDRTIRIWNISDTSSRENAKRLPDGRLNMSDAGLLEETIEADSTGCLAMIMGHASRIWGLRFLTQKDGWWDLMTYGEDGTAQIWRVSSIIGNGRTMETPHKDTYQLSHQTTYSYHSGKNLWATAVSQKASEDCIVATGGADGRVTIYKPFLHGATSPTAAWAAQYTIDEILKTLQPTTSDPSPTEAGKAMSSTEKIFGCLKGSWKLSRNLDSLVSTYPSGRLEGTAIFARRPPTDTAYDAEYLYSESGEFTTEQRLMMKATRQYVYRYSRATDTISVWFVKPDDGSAVDYFFHDLGFQETAPKIERNPEVRSASGYHLCVEDNYNAQYSFGMEDSRIKQWHAVFDVDGPKKNYSAKATYTRDQAESLDSEELEYVAPPTVEKTRDALGNQSGQNKLGAFKIYTWISENEVLTSTEHGNLLVGTLVADNETSKEDNSRKVIWEHVGHQTSLRTSCIATSISSLGIALLTGNDGTVFSYSHRSRALNAIGKLPGKAGSLKAHVLSEPWNRWLRLSHGGKMVGVFATCLGSSQATMFTFSMELEATDSSTSRGTKLPSIYECHLTLPSKFIVISSCLLDTEIWVILGSRNGEIAIYDLTHSTPDLALGVAPNCFQNIHGEDAITLIQMAPQEISKRIGRIAIITAGRDGKWAIHCAFHRVEESGLCVTFQTIHVGAPPFVPNIEGACIDSTSKDILLWGFRSKQFVVWNESQKTEVMVVDCGGAHRNWAYAHRHDGNGGGSFVYTKASVCHIHSQTQASHQVIQHGGHGREIKAITISPAIKIDDDFELNFVATGAEDTTIRIFDLNEELDCLSIITKHTTGIQQLRWSIDGQRLFSAAGCEEFFVWRLQSAPLVTIGVVCEAQCPAVTEEVDLRIMDFALEEIHSDRDPDNGEYEHDYLLSMVYSDSSVRIFRYHTSTRQTPFELLTQASYTTYCLTQATHLYLGETLSGLCTASTDGHLAFWPLEHPLSRHDDDLPTCPPLRYSTRTAIHQSSVKALDSVPLSSSERLVVTGGDDGAIAFTRVATRSPAFETASLLIPNAHASAVTGMVIFASTSDSSSQIKNKHESKNGVFTLASVGNDQRLKIWNVDIEDTKTERKVEGIRISRIANVHTSIADASSLATYRDARGRQWLLVAGIGMERWRVGGGGEESVVLC